MDPGEHCGSHLRLFVKKLCLKAKKSFKAQEQKNKQKMPSGQEQEGCEGITCSERKRKERFLSFAVVAQYLVLTRVGL